MAQTRRPAWSLGAPALLVTAVLMCTMPVCAQEEGRETVHAGGEEQPADGQLSEADAAENDLPAEETSSSDGEATDDEDATEKEALSAAADLFRALPRFGEALFAAASTGSAGMPAANTPVPPNYVIGAGDSLSLRVWARRREQVAETLRVSSEGLVVLPQLGTLAVAGERLEQLRQALTKAYREFYADPTVTLVVAEQRVVEVYVTGEAASPGKYTLVGMATVFTALYAAGGPSAIGSYRDIRLLRRGQDPIRIDLYDYLLRGRRDQYVMLQPGDTLFIPPLEGQVGVEGEVRRPARYELSGETTVGEALAMAGGLEPTSYAPAVELWRAAEHRRWQLTALDCSEPDSPDLRQPVQDGDLLRVRPVLTQADNTVEIVGAVRRPGEYPLAQAGSIADLLAAAEGLAVDAHMDTGVLRRLNDDLDYELIPFSVRDVAGGVDGTDLPLRPYDVVEILSQDAVEPAFEVEVSGPVARPGKYAWSAGMRVSRLMLLAGGPLPGAYLERATVLRLTADQRREVIKVALQAALAGDRDSDLELACGDLLRVALREEAVPASVAHVDGYVQTPGTYPRDEGMRVSDLIFAAGGLQPGAGPVLEFAAGRCEGKGATVELRLIGGPEDYQVEPDLLLSDDDSVAVAGRGDFKARAEVVYLRGQMRVTGSFVLNSEGHDGPYTVWDLVQNGGGLLPDASPEGMVLYRRQPELLDEAQAGDVNRVLKAVNRETQAPVMQVTSEEQAAAMNANVAQSLRMTGLRQSRSRARS